VNKFDKIYESILNPTQDWNSGPVDDLWEIEKSLRKTYSKLYNMYKKEKDKNSSKEVIKRLKELDEILVLYQDWRYDFANVFSKIINDNEQKY
jgi:hypothetical protein